MSSSYGENIRLTIFGQSHSKAIGMTLEGIPAGESIDLDELNAFMKRRAPGQNELSTPRREGDVPEFISGMVGNISCGTPITAIIHNKDTRSGDYEELKVLPRPGHADYTAQIKYNGFQDYAGGGHFSGRMTAPLCIAGAICKQLLAKEGIRIISRIRSIGDITDDLPLTEDISDKAFCTVSDSAGEKMKKLILDAKNDLDSVGGTIQCKAIGVSAGLGDPMFDGIENKIASIAFAIPAVKGIEFGIGFESARLKGSENNDEFVIKDGEVKTVTNNCGGILGGITNGMPVDFTVAIKPTPSIARMQNTVNLETNENAKLSIKGRHDPCIVTRALPCVESACAIALYDALLSRRRQNNGH